MGYILPFLGDDLSLQHFDLGWDEFCFLSVYSHRLATDLG